MGSEVEISGNVEMYLATIATLQIAEQPSAALAVGRAALSFPSVGE